MLRQLPSATSLGEITYLVSLAETTHWLEILRLLICRTVEFVGNSSVRNVVGDDQAPTLRKTRFTKVCLAEL